VHVPVRGRGLEHRGAFVIALSALHKYMDNKGYPTRYLVLASVDIAKQLGFTPGRDICMRIATSWPTALKTW
jgi:hypothetical protein